MPIYEYQCSACGAALEKLQRLSDPPLETCPACGKDTLRKLVSAARFRLKGGGWYETDFKKERQKNLHDSVRKDGAEKGQDKTKPGTDAKPAAKQEKPADRGSKPGKAPSGSD